MNLYFHVPFCRGKCDYCAFYSEGAAPAEDQKRWLRKIQTDLDAFSCDEPVSTLYIGGGTPTALEPEILSTFFTALKRRFRFAPESEITSECNPGSLTPEKAEIFGSFINRVSMGVQSFRKETLRTLGRRAAPESAAPTFVLLRKNGITNLGLDLIYGVPGTTVSDWKRDAEAAMELDPVHVSAYALSVEDGTPLAARFTEDDLPDEDFQADCWELADSVFSRNGLVHYEISNSAKPGFECRHNCNIWHGEPYGAFGPSACSFDGSDRKTQPVPLEAWLRNEPPETDSIPRTERLHEIFIMGLRTVRGWNAEEFDWRDLLPRLQLLQSDGLIELTESVCRPTRRGLLCWNTIAENLLP